MTSPNLTQIALSQGVPTGGSGNVSTIDALIQTATITVTPTVTTSNNYGNNFVVGGLLTFSNAFQGKGSGILQSVFMTIKDIESTIFTLNLFSANPSSSTWTDAAVAAINAADVTKLLAPVPLTNYQNLGTATVAANVGIGYAIALGAGNTTLYGVLTSATTLTNQFAGASDVSVSLTILQDGNS